MSDLISVAAALYWDKGVEHVEFLAENKDFLSYKSCSTSLNGSKHYVLNTSSFSPHLFSIFLDSVASGSGVHWFVLHRRSSDLYEVFDSLGTTAAYVKKVLRRKGFCDFNVTRLQSSSSKNCGKFCLYFIIERYFNLDLSYDELLLSAFSTNLEENENCIHNFFESF